jgi:hypothetical protein
MQCKPHAVRPKELLQAQTPILNHVDGLVEMQGGHTTSRLR